MLIEMNMRADDLIRSLKSAPQDIQDAVAVELTQIGDDLVSYVRSDKLSGQYLNSKTGELANSLVSRVKVNRVNIRVDISADTPYARILHDGGTTSPHTIVATKADLLRFVMGGTVMFRKSVNHPGSTFPERPYLTDALSEKANEIENRIANAINTKLGATSGIVA